MLTAKEIKGDIFVIPNHAGKAEDFLGSFSEKMAEYGKKICEANGKMYDEDNDYFVQTWMVSEDAGSDNMARHGFDVDVDGEKYYIWRLEENIPRQLIDLSEGESATINLLGKGYRNSEDFTNDNYVDVMIPVIFTAAQTKYRYRNFGNFEDVIERVCR